MFQHKVCNIEYDNALNTRLHERIFPSQELQPNFDPRPVPTKYTHFVPMGDTSHSIKKLLEIHVPVLVHVVVCIQQILWQQLLRLWVCHYHFLHQLLLMIH